MVDALRVEDGAAKFDSEKPRMDLVPPDSVIEIAKVFTYGARKYSDHNWRNNMRHGRIYAAMQRHLNAYWEGEDNDKESGFSHLAHAGCCLMMLLWCNRNQQWNDDRWFNVNSEPLAEK